MTEKKVWFITGAGRGMGVHIAKARLAQALVTIAGEEQPPSRRIAGADAIGLAEQKVADLQAQIDAYRGLSTSLALDEFEPVGSAR
jgi:NAD(P)-dependent dehydrogenase (short-subunit alcohol dehydrogenase family)